ncbi:MAG: hypothetical protein FJZ11_00215 [Candidatus Omnitrophica bacterium]|nr:hypothetical protein [Candidatus Omnitrophota bacterium]
MSLNRKKHKVIAMVPAKIGSKRLAMKNLALLDGEPLIYYAVQAAKKSRVFDKVVINAEDMIFEGIAKRYNVDFYKRPDSLVKPTTKTDTVVYDFLLKNPCDIVAWVSPIAPLQSAQEVRRIVQHFLNKKFDSLMTVKNEQVHCVYKDKPINFNFDEIFAQTQDLLPIQSFVYSVMMWRSQTFMRTFEENGYALLCGKVGFYPVDKLSAIIIKKKEDLLFAESILNVIRLNEVYKVKYDKIANIFLRGI